MCVTVTRHRHGIQVFARVISITLSSAAVRSDVLILIGGVERHVIAKHRLCFSVTLPSHKCLPYRDGYEKHRCGAFCTFRAAELVSRPSPLINKFQDTLGSVIASLAL